MSCCDTPLVMECSDWPDAMSDCGCVCTVVFSLGFNRGPRDSDRTCRSELDSWTTPERLRLLRDANAATRKRQIDLYEQVASTPPSGEESVEITAAVDGLARFRELGPVR